MAWPLTGSALTKYNRLLSDLRQYGDFIFVGAPDDITWLQEIIVAASDGALHPSLDDVANRSHYWMLKLARVLGEKVVVCPECPECPPVIPCPPCPPCPPLTGIDWGPDNTTLDVSPLGFLDLTTLGSGTGVTSVILRNLETITGGDFFLFSTSFMESFLAPELVSVDGDFDLDSNLALSSVDLPKLATVGGDFLVIDNLPVIVSAEFPSLATVGGTLKAAVNCPSLVSVSYPALTTVGADFNSQSCPALVSISVPSLVSAGGNFILGPLLSLQNIDLPSFTGATGDFLAPGSGLVTVNIPVFVPFNGQNLDFVTNALSAASVNHILARCVANAAYVSGTIDTSGGTSSAPTGQGIADKATLIGRGVTVTTN